jgi:glutaminyl-tRNA synthetase
MAHDEAASPSNFIRQIIDADLAEGRHDGRVITRFPPEPNGYLHIGHAKSICLNFGIANDYQGRCYMRFDDTNPAKEDTEFVESILADVRWLGFDWGEHRTHASDYFERLFECAAELIRRGKAYVCSLSAQEIREFRGTLTEPGQESPYRNRSAEQNQTLLAAMRHGECADGEHVVRAKIDMASPNLNMRDPVIYRIRTVAHHRTGEAWPIYPMYDFTHCLSDAFEGVTHSLCTLEFEDHRALYDWVLDTLEFTDRPHQYEFSRMNLEYTVLSKRHLTTLVSDGHVESWDDPRMPTIAALRRRGYPAQAIVDFCDRIGITKKDNAIEIGVLENCAREALDKTAPRALAVLNPLKVVVTNYPEDASEVFAAPNHPQDASYGTREVPFCREIYIERDDFMEDPPRKFFRLAPGREVRLRFAYLVTFEGVLKDAAGEVTEVHVRYDPESRGGQAPDGRKVKGTIHWVSARHAFNAPVRLYDRLFNVPVPGKTTGAMEDDLNPESIQVMTNAWLEPSLADAAPGSLFQFERNGYFNADPVDSKPGQPVFNRTVSLRDSWARKAKK